MTPMAFGKNLRRRIVDPDGRSGGYPCSLLEDPIRSVGAGPTFLTSKTHRFGLNLTSLSNVFYYEPRWG